MPYLVAIVDCTHVRSATASFKDLVIVAQENSTNQTADVLVEDQPHPSLDLVTSFPGARILQMQNNRTEYSSFILLIMQHPNMVFTQLQL